MAGDWAEIGKEVVKLVVRARYSFSIWVVCLIILAASLPSFLRLDAFRESHGQYVGLLCLTAFVLWVVEVAILGSERLRAELSKRREEMQILAHIDTLNSREAHLLATAVQYNVQTVTWRHDADEVSSLVAKGLLYIVPYGAEMFHHPFTVPGFVWKKIKRADTLSKIRAIDREVQD